MKNFKQQALSMALVSLALAGTSAQAQTSTADAQLFAVLYNKLQAVCRVDVATAGKVGTSTLILAQPGIALPLFNKEVDNDVDFKEEMAVTLNRLPAPSFFYSGLSDSVEKVWAAILDYKVSPTSTLSDADKQRKEGAEAFLNAVAPKEVIKVSYKDTNKPNGAPPIVESFDSPEGETVLERYYRYKILFDEANDAYLANKTSSIAKTNFDAANNNLKLKGRKAEVEAKLELFNELTGKDPLNFWAKEQEVWKASEVKNNNGIPFHEVRTIPNAKTLKDDAGWTTVTVDTSTDKYSESMSKLNAGASVKGSYGLFRGAASGDYSKDSSMKAMSSSSMKITFQVKRALIYRPWLNSIVFKAGFWKINGDLDAAKAYMTISAGKGIDGTDHGTEVMPLLPTEVLLARNVKIESKFTAEQISEITKAMSGKGAASFGPFALTAHFSKNSKSYDRTASVSTGSISFNEPQIIGFYCDVLGKAPNPTFK